MHASETRKNGQLFFVAVGTGIETYALYKYLKSMTDEENLYEEYYQPDRFWTDGKAIKELHKITTSKGNKSSSLRCDKT